MAEYLHHEASSEEHEGICIVLCPVGIEPLLGAERGSITLVALELNIYTAQRSPQRTKLHVRNRARDDVPRVSAWLRSFENTCRIHIPLRAESASTIATLRDYGAPFFMCWLIIASANSSAQTGHVSLQHKAHATAAGRTTTSYVSARPCHVEASRSLCEIPRCTART